MTSSVPVQAQEVEYKNSVAVFNPAEPAKIDLTVGGRNIGGQSDQMLAQTFTAEWAGNLAEVYLPISCTSGTLVIEISKLRDDGKPGDVIAGKTFDEVNVPRVGPTYRRFALFPGKPIPVVAGESYAVVLSNAAGTQGSCAIFLPAEGDTYAGGKAFYRGTGTDWIEYSEPLCKKRLDLAFSTGTVITLP